MVLRKSGFFNEMKFIEFRSNPFYRNTEKNDVMSSCKIIQGLHQSVHMCDLD